MAHGYINNGYIINKFRKAGKAHLISEKFTYSITLGSVGTSVNKKMPT